MKQEFRLRYPQGHFWSPGTFYRTVGDADAETVIQYVHDSRAPADHPWMHFFLGSTVPHKKLCHSWRRGCHLSHVSFLHSPWAILHPPIVLGTYKSQHGPSFHILRVYCFSYGFLSSRYYRPGIATYCGS